MNGQLTVDAIIGLFRLMPFPVVCRLGDGLGAILYQVMKERTALGLSNLERAFPEKSETERKTILKAFWQNFCKDMLEMIKYYGDPAPIKSRVAISGREYLDRLMAERRGVILLSAHLGIFPLLCAKLGMEGYPIAVIYSEMHNKLFNPVLPRMQRSLGIEPISDRQRYACVSKSISWLKKGGILFLQIDQSPPTEAGLPVSFFGYKTPTSRGPVSLAMRTGATILPAFIVREKSDHHRIIIDRPFTLKLAGDNNEDIINNLESLSKITEDYIRQYPTHWWWIHQRFRKAVKE